MSRDIKGQQTNLRSHRTAFGDRRKVHRLHSAAGRAHGQQTLINVFGKKGRKRGHKAAQNKQSFEQDRKRRFGFFLSIRALEPIAVQTNIPVRELVNKANKFRHDSVQMIHGLTQQKIRYVGVRGIRLSKQNKDTKKTKGRTISSRTNKTRSLLSAWIQRSIKLLEFDARRGANAESQPVGPRRTAF